MDVFELQASLTLDTSGYESSLNNASNSAQTAGHSIENSMKGASNGAQSAGKSLADMADTAIGKLIPGVSRVSDLAISSVAGFASLGTAAIAAGKALMDAAEGGAKFVDDVNTLSSTTGLAVETIQELKYMEDLVDVSLNTVSSSMRVLTNSMDSASKGTGDAAAAFEKLGVSVTDSSGNLRSSEDVFFEVIAALGEIGNTAERNATAMDVFGRSAQNLNPMIEAGAEGLERFRQAAHDSGYVLSEIDMGNLQELQDASDTLSKSWDAFSNTLGAKVAPVIASVKEGFSSLLEAATQVMNGENFGDSGGMTYALKAQQAAAESLNMTLEEYREKVLGIKEATEEAEEPVISLGDMLRDSYAGANEAAAEAKAAAEEFAAAWQDGFEKLRNSFDGVFDIFTSAEDVMSSMSNTGIESLGQLQDSLEAQTQYWEEYADNVEAATNRNIEGMAEWLQANNDGSAEFARILQLMAEADQESVEAYIASWKQKEDAMTQAAAKSEDGAMGISDSAEEINSSLEGVAESAEDMESRFSEAMSGMQSTATTMGSTVVSALESVKEGATNAGKMVGQGFAEGLRLMIAEVEAAASELAKAAEAAINKAAQIHSPSKVAMEQGEFVGEGFAVGIENSTNMVENAASGLVDAASSATGLAISFGKQAGEGYADGVKQGLEAERDELERKITQFAMDALIIHPGEVGNYDTSIVRLYENQTIGAANDLLEQMLGTQYKHDQGWILAQQNWDFKALVERYNELEEQLGEANRGIQVFGDDIVVGKKLGTVLPTLEEQAEKFKNLRTADEYDEAAKWLYDLAQDRISDFVKYDGGTTQQERDMWADMLQYFNEGSQQYLDAERKVKDLDIELANERAKAQADALKAQYNAEKSEIDRKISLYDLGYTEQIALYEAFRDEYEEGGAQWAAINEKIDDLIFKSTKETFKNIENAQEQFVDSIEDMAGRIDGYYQDIEALQQSYYDAVDSRTGTLAGTWGMFGEVTQPDSAEAMRAGDIIKNLKDQVGALQEYSDTLDSLAERGVGEDILSGLRDAGPDNLEILRALNGATDQQLGQIVDLYAEKFALAGDQAVEELEPFREEVNTQIEELIGEINSVLTDELPETYALFDSVLAEEMAKGFPETEAAAIAGVQRVIDAMNEKLGVYYNGQGFAVNTVKFEDSAVGQAAAATINATTGGGKASASGQPLEVVVQLNTGVEVAREFLPNLIAVADANGTPIASDIYV